MIDQQQGQPRLNVGSQAPTGAPRRVAGSRQCTAMHNRVRDLKDTMNSLDLDDLSAPGGGLSWSDYIFSWKYDPIDIAIGEQIRTPSRDPLSPRQFQDGRSGIARTEFRATASPRCEFAKPGMEAPWVAGPRVWFAQVPMMTPFGEPGVGCWKSECAWRPQETNSLRLGQSGQKAPASEGTYIGVRFLFFSSRYIDFHFLYIAVVFAG